MTDEALDHAIAAELEAMERNHAVPAEEWARVLRVIAETQAGSWIGKRMALVYLRGVRRSSRRKIVS